MDLPWAGCSDSESDAHLHFHGYFIDVAWWLLLLPSHSPDHPEYLTHADQGEARLLHWCGLLVVPENILFVCKVFTSQIFPMSDSFRRELIFPWLCGEVNIDATDFCLIKKTIRTHKSLDPSAVECYKLCNINVYGTVFPSIIVRVWGAHRVASEPSMSGICRCPPRRASTPSPGTFHTAGINSRPLQAPLDYPSSLRWE